jgi:hypothetical protein
LFHPFWEKRAVFRVVSRDASRLWFSLSESYCGEETMGVPVGAVLGVAMMGLSVLVLVASGTATLLWPLGEERHGAAEPALLPRVNTTGNRFGRRVYVDQKTSAA